MQVNQNSFNAVFLISLCFIPWKHSILGSALVLCWAAPENAWAIRSSIAGVDGLNCSHPGHPLLRGFPQVILLRRHAVSLSLSRGFSTKVLLMVWTGRFSGVGGCPLYWRMFSSIPGLSSHWTPVQPSPCNSRKISRHHQASPSGQRCPQGRTSALSSFSLKPRHLLWSPFWSCILAYNDFSITFI